LKRIYHPWDKWECYAAGFYASEGPADALELYAEFLRDTDRFKIALRRVVTEWPHSCEQFLSNENLNRIAWLGQAAMCIETGIPARFRAGFKLLSNDEQAKANDTAAEYLRYWCDARKD
jgi:hypothetical protein